MLPKMQRMLGLLGALFVLAGSGCGKNLVFNDSVQGTAKLDGKALVSVMVTFIPDADPKLQAPSSSGYTDADGNFTLRRDDGEPGALVGKHRVVLQRGREANRALGEEADDTEAAASSKGKKDRRPIPPAYGTAVKTPLFIEVTPDKHTYDVLLK
jgi:hypothetical protein